MNRVLQAFGRVIRSERDGVLMNDEQQRPTQEPFRCLGKVASLPILDAPYDKSALRILSGIGTYSALVRKYGRSLQEIMRDIRMNSLKELETNVQNCV